MGILADKYKSDVNRSGTFSTVLHTIPSMVRWLVGFFTLTEAERLQAGIYLGGEGRD
jgi:hypothetical protein